MKSAYQVSAQSVFEYPTRIEFVSPCVPAASSNRVRRCKLAVVRIAALLLVVLSMATVALFVAADEAHASAGGHPVVVSMGDSYSSGEGTEPFYNQNDPNKHNDPDWLAHRSEKAWPGKLVIGGVELKSRKDNGWYFVAASGAETRHILTEKQVVSWKYQVNPLEKRSGSKSLDLQIDKVDENSGAIDYVTLTIGGNDLGFADIVTAAAKEFSQTHDALDAELTKAYEKFDDIKDDLVELYKTIHKRAGAQSKVVVAGYPHLFAKGGESLVDENEAARINLAVDVFNNEMRDLVAGCGDDGIVFVDVRSEFSGHEASYINGVIVLPKSEDLKQFTIGEDIPIGSHYSVHPNEHGQEAYARVVQPVIENLEAGKSSNGAIDVESDVAMSLVFDVSGSMDERSALNGMTKLASAKKQSGDFVNSVAGKSGPGGLSVKVGVASFADSAKANCGLSNDPADIVASINALRADGMTNIYAGLDEGIRQLSGEDGPKLMVFLSDGLSNVGKPESEIIALARQAADADIAIYTIGFGSAGSLDEALLKEIASITGGTYEHEDSSNISSAAVGLFATMMNAQLKATSQVKLDAVGAVRQGATDEVGTFDVDANGTVQVYLYWPGSTLDMVLTDPDGSQVKEGYAGVTVDTSAIPTSIKVDNAKRGTWSMSVFGREVSMTEEPYYAVAAFNETPAPAASGGGGAPSDGGGLLFVALSIGIACVVAVFAFTKRRGSHDL